MGKMITLLDVIRDIHVSNNDLTIYARQPWLPSSLALLASEEVNGKIPTEAQKKGLEYFLELFVAREFLEDWINLRGVTPSDQDQCERLIQYAIYDA